MSERLRRKFERPAPRQEQVERVVRLNRKIGERAVRQLSHEEESRQALLDLPASRLLRGLTMPGATEHRLREAGIRTIRDVVVLGPGRLGVREGPRTRVYTALKDKHPELHDERFSRERFEPSVEDIARICYDLEQVHANVLPSFRREYWRIHNEVSSKADYPVVANGLRLTVANILDASDPVQAAVTGAYDPRFDDIPHMRETPFSFATMRAEAVEFGEAFLRAQKGAR